MIVTATPPRQPQKSVAVVVDHKVEQLVRSKARVKAYGEVFTPKHMVNQMLDLVKSELETGPDFVDKTFFEPAAGDGNFLIAILHRKLSAIENRYRPDDLATESLFALASIYGVELLEDNLQGAQEGMLAEFLGFQQRHGIECGSRTNLRSAAEFLIASNIRRGNTLTGLDPDGREIHFSWWNRVLNVAGTVQRDPFTLASLRNQDSGMFSFDTFETYAPCLIDHVHQEKRADG